MIIRQLTYGGILKKYGISYLGSAAKSAKLIHSLQHGTLTYAIYLAPSNMSGHNVCPKSAHCREHCLNQSGHNKADILAHGFEGSKVNNARIKRARLFYDDREAFMVLLMKEIERYQKVAEKEGLAFSVRLNGTSDISPLAFKYDGKCILDIYPNIQFYDYTKVFSRTNLLRSHDNYDITFSYDGYNWDECEKYLSMGGRAAVVFYGGLPETYKGYKVVNGDKYDMRYLDEQGCVIGLKYKVGGTDYVMGEDGKRHFVIPNVPFVVRTDI